MSELDVKLAGKSLADFTNTQLRLALGAVLYTNTADMWRRYLNQLGYSGDVSQMLRKYYVEYSVPQNFRNYINAGAFVYTPQQLFADGSKGVFYDNNDFVDSATWRRNLLTYTEEFSNAIWAKTGSAITANTTVAPDGTSTADTLTAYATTDRHRVASPAIAISLGSAAVGSVYLKAGTSNFAILSVSGSTTNSAWSGVVVNLSTGAITSTSNGAGASAVTASITAVGNGWYRLVLTAVCGSDATANLNVNVSDTATPTLGNYAAYSWTAAGTESILVWGVQLEVGSAATAYQRITDFNSDFLAAFPRTTLFLDAAGTVPATVNGLVGLQLDKSAGLALGAELVTNGGFDSDISGWTNSGTGTFVWSAGSGRFTRSASTDFASATVTTTAGKWYEVRASASIVSGSLGRIAAGPVNSITSGSNSFVSAFSGQTRLVFLATGASSYVCLGADANATVVDFDNISVKELPGNHRYQTTTGSKPVLRGTPTGANLVTNGDFASDTVWTKDAGWTISSGTASKAAGSAANIAQSLVLDAGRIVRVSYTIASISGGAVFIRLIGGAVVDGASRTTAGTFVEYLTVPASMTSFAIRGASTTVATIDNIEVMDVSAGSVTAPYGLQYDGVDDFLQTAAVDFTATDKMFVCAGVRKLSDAGTSILAELSVNVNANNGSFVVVAPLAGPNYSIECRGTVKQGATATTYASPITNVVSGVLDISGDIINVRVNGSQVAQTLLDQGAGNYGNYALYFGRRGGTSLPYNGLDFGMVICGKTLTSTQISQTERYIAQRTGISL